ncbi:protein of unknown function [Aminobacter niigataensis]|nr:protein of unknown function [Aminobacter niigataensis]
MLCFFRSAIQTSHLASASSFARDPTHCAGHHFDERGLRAVKQRTKCGISHSVLLNSIAGLEPTRCYQHRFGSLLFRRQERFQQGFGLAFSWGLKAHRLASSHCLVSACASHISRPAGLVFDRGSGRGLEVHVGQEPDPH